MNKRLLIAHVVCWFTLGLILGIVCSCNVKNNASETVPVQEFNNMGNSHSYEVREVPHRYEVRIGFSDYTYSNGTWKDTIFTSLSLKESEKYLNEHKATHTNLVIYDLKTDVEVDNR